ncbi:glycine receptor subunit alpha-2 [Hyalella azteca]|uniref:Glycine receptor subunit alpha-2 n=1 Tax=Hyalella azteca TaxID=294128 RepID=A0A8B7NQQ4_HYAAZ|nr:glycine receptor subunit alpha-2 [Hyalella azteca]
MAPRGRLALITPAWLSAAPLLLMSLSAVCGSSFSMTPPGYQKDLRPQQVNGGPVVVGFSMKMNSISQVNMETMSVTFQMNLRVTWVDPRLIYPHQNVSRDFSRSTIAPEDGSDDRESEVTSIAVSTQVLRKIWVPDPFFRRMRDLKTFHLLQDVQGVKIYSNNKIYTSMVLKLELGCSMMFTNYPFDEQECELYIGSYFYPITEMQFEWLSSSVTLDDEVLKLLAGYDFQVKPINDTRCFCEKCVPQWSPCVRTQLYLERRYLVHLLGYYIPSALFVGVSWCSFFWPADVIPGRTVLVITSLLTVSSMYAASRQSSPMTSYVKAIDTWMFMTILLTVLTLFQYAVVLQWRKRADAARVNQVQPNDKGSTTTQVESAVQRYIRYEDYTEKAARYGLPLLFLLFNLVYWPYYLNT